MTSQKILDVQKIREDFPLLHCKNAKYPLIYFDNAATTQKPKMVIDRVSTFYENEYGTVHRAIYDLSSYATDLYSKVRSKIKTWIHAQEESEIIFTKGTTEAINLVAFSFGEAFIEEGDEVILSVAEHHSNMVPWQLMAKRKKAHIHYIPINEKGELILEEYEKLLSEKTKIVSIAHISNTTGTIHPVRRIISTAHRVGAKVLIDGAQAAPHFSLDMQDLDADFYAFSSHKMYGPTGVGILYGKKELLERLPPYQGGGDMIQEVSLVRSTFAPPPLRFEAGTPMIAEVIGLGAVIDYLNQIDFHSLQKHEEDLLNYATKKLHEVDRLRIIGTAEVKSAIISFFIQDVHPLDLATLLNQKGIAIRSGHMCAQPTLEFFQVPALSRISFGIYNTREEIDIFLQKLNEVLPLLRVQ